MITTHDIETPALLIDLDTLEANIDAMQTFAAAAGVQLRPHAKTSKSPEIAAMQIQAGAIGICCAKLSEAAVMVEGGIENIMITTPVVGSAKMDKLVGLARKADIGVVVDNPDNAKALSSAAVSGGVELGVYVELDVGQHRTGLADPGALADVAARVFQLPGLSLGGMQAYNGAIQFVHSIADRRAAAKRVAELIADAKSVFEAKGLPLPVVSGGGTGTASFDIEFGQLSELQAGSYIFMDGQYERIEWPAQAPRLQPALSILASTISAAAPDRIVLDSGWKAVSVDGGTPTAINYPNAQFEFGGDEHGILKASGAESLPAYGEKVELRPPHCDTTVNLYDKAFAIRGGVVSHEIALTGRGCSQ